MPLTFWNTRTDSRRSAWALQAFRSGRLSVPLPPGAHHCARSRRLLGPDIQAAVLKEAREMRDKAQAHFEQLLTSRRWQLDALAQALLQREVASGERAKGLLSDG